MYREITNNSDFWGYNAFSAQNKSDIRNEWKNHFKLLNQINQYQEFSSIFVSKYDKKTFGVKPTYTFVKMNYDIKIPSLRTVFNWINSNQWVIKKKERLRMYYKPGGKELKTVVDTLVGARWVRPFWFQTREINQRNTFGHWEVDLIVGKSGADNYDLLIFQERLTRYGIITKFQGKNPVENSRSFMKLDKEISIKMLKSVTADNGFEFRTLFILHIDLKFMSTKLILMLHFKKGSIENFNDIVRRFYKKGKNFNLVSDDEIKETQDKINSMPREIFDWMSADELFYNWNYYKEQWTPIPDDEKFFIKTKRQRESNYKKNKFFKNKKY
ncbi:IS30 family transposase [Mycoplasmopsis verecunda]|uniref:IS30 family transposase n=1 Tax=Mycoplasmopsis verecunda TaxID=171291 RepID=UPI00298D25FB|nr:IS30 family transposase [Mycoplasmopsis verecunda]WPB54749.1 IS30 family transposase [Mycoplasmopsis verecunda]